MHYRPEIDGLRALAVLPVMLFHAGFKTFGGGFVGVDVFFVISGYLITSIISAELDKGNFSLWTFYERRARRILPALFFVLAAIFPFTWLWLLPPDMQSFSQSLMAVSVFASNILFWATSGYFDTASELKPLLHTWSLAVEEQYYLFFPVLLMLTWQWGKRKLCLLLFFFALLSLCLAIWGSTAKPMATFYWLPTRGWELLIGALCSLTIHSKQCQSLKPHATSLSLLGLVMLTIANLFYHAFLPYPGVYALLPTCGTALIILFAHADTLTGRLLAQRWLVGIGLISYSAYLWHQPLLALAKHRSITPPSSAVLGGMLILSLLLAYASWRWVETPFRDKQRFSRAHIFGLALAGSCLWMLLGAAGQWTHGFAFRNPLFSQFLTTGTAENSYCHTTGRRNASQIAQGDFCTLGATTPLHAATAHTLVIGDSHAGALFEGLQRQGQQNGFAFLAVSGGFCVPLPHFRLSAFQTPDCEATTNAAYAYVQAHPQITHVVLVAEWANYVQGTRDDGGGAEFPAVLVADEEGQATTADDNKAVFARALRKTVRQLIDQGKQVIIVKPVPEFGQRVMDTVYKIRLFSGDIADRPQLTRQQYAARNASVLEVFAALEKEMPSALHFVDPAQLFCSKQYCDSIDTQGNPRYSDTNHITEFGAQPIAAAIAKQLATMH